MKHRSVLMIMVLVVTATSLWIRAAFTPRETHAQTLARHGVAVDAAMTSRLKAAELSVKQEWRGLQVPTQGVWDFYGLPVDMNTPAVAKAQKDAIRADYNWTGIDRSNIPDAYKAAKPAFSYAPALDPLYITVSLTPRILYFPQLATAEECEYAVATTAPKLTRSQVALSKDDEGKSTIQEVRTSKSTWLPLTGQLADLDKRLSAVMGLTQHEPMNVLHYGPMQHYDAHHDYFDPKRYGQQSSNRMGTFFLYLNDTEAGGSTTVPRANNGRFPANYKEASCNQGLQIFPRKGSAFLLYDMRPDRTFDEFSLHGGCDVEKGTKWGGVVWFRINTPDSK